MEPLNNKELIKKLYAGNNMLRDEWRAMLTSLNDDERNFLRSFAADITRNSFGRGIYIRGLIEISSFCRNNCFYCGLRRSNLSAQRYRLTKEEILDCCAQGASIPLCYKVARMPCRMTSG